MIIQETKTPFWQDVVMVLSVFVITLSLGVLVSVKKLEAQEKRVEMAKIDVPSVAQVQVKPVELPEIEEAAMLKTGEGIEHALIRQLVKSGSDLKSAQKKAHQIALLSGFVSSNRETRAKDGQIKVAYVLDQQGGQIVTFLNGNEIRRTQIADDYQQIKQLAPMSFEYNHS